MTAVSGYRWQPAPQEPRDEARPARLRLGLFEDLQPDAAIQFHPRGVENRADGSGHTALLANDFTEIARGNPQLQNCNVLAFYDSDGDRFRDVNQSFSDVFDQLFHVPASVVRRPRKPQPRYPPEARYRGLGPAQPIAGTAIRGYVYGFPSLSGFWKRVATGRGTV